MRHKTKQNIKKAGTVFAVLIVGIFAGAALFGDSDTSSSPENRTFVQELQESISGVTSSVTSTYEPYTVEVIGIEDAPIYTFKGLVNADNVHISIKNNDDKTHVFVITQAGIVYEDGVQQSASEIRTSLDRYNQLYGNEVSLYPEAKSDFYIAFEDIDKSRNPKMAFTCIVDGRDETKTVKQHSILLTPYL
jgi:hypothetical protein